MILALLVLLLAFAWFRYGSGRRYWPVLEYASGWGLKIGAMGFALGFFGPMLLTPGANQGPMLGIFITGPLGFVAGLVYGCWRGWSRRAG